MIYSRLQTFLYHKYFVDHLIAMLVIGSLMTYYRRKLYFELFEYDMPLVHPEPKVFTFLDSNCTEYENPWKESVRQLVSYNESLDSHVFHN